MEVTHVVKVRHFDGWQVVASGSEDFCFREAARLNLEFQTDEYRVGVFDLGGAS